MNYYITVSDDKQILEKIVFEYLESALAFVERRRKQGYTVTLKVVSVEYELKGE